MDKLIPNTNYKIDKQGVVTNVRTGNVLVPTANPKTGYYYVTIYYIDTGHSSSVRVHKLMRDAFMLDTKPTLPGNWEIGHKDDDKSNNKLSNLYWTTHKDNCNYGERNSKISKSLKGHIARKDIIQKVKCVETNQVFRSITMCCDVLNLTKSDVAKHLKAKGEYYHKRRNIHIVKV